MGISSDNAIDTDKLANAAEEMQKAIDNTSSEITIKFFR